LIKKDLMDTRAMDGLILGVEEQEKGGGFF
jgi:hypothetical protein